MKLNQTRSGGEGARSEPELDDEKPDPELEALAARACIAADETIEQANALCDRLEKDGQPPKPR